jgi:SAM-dependent methyltransferase
MPTFADYADCYDLIYADKDYAGEARKVADALAAHGVTAGTLLDVGCGTGRHAIEFMKAGFEVTGTDLSDTMLGYAAARRAALPDDAGVATFAQGDATNMELGQRFDTVVSLFHVMCYQTTPDALAAAFRTAARHLNPGGVFLFDFWYGPAVQADPPTLRVKRVADDRLRVVRIAEPDHDPVTNVVHVHYQIFSERDRSGAWAMTEEMHTVRYLFEPEIRDALTAAGFTDITVRDWASDGPATPGTWNAYCVARLGAGGAG